MAKVSAGKKIKKLMKNKKKGGLFSATAGRGQLDPVTLMPIMPKPKTVKTKKKK